MRSFSWWPTRRASLAAADHAVMNHLPGYLRHAVGLATSVITPFHHRIPETQALRCGRSAGRCAILWRFVTVDLYRYDDRWIGIFSTLRATSAAARQHAGRTSGSSGPAAPLRRRKQSAEQWAILRRDALFFGAAVAARCTSWAGIDWTLSCRIGKRSRPRWHPRPEPAARPAALSHAA